MRLKKKLVGLLCNIPLLGLSFFLIPYRFARDEIITVLRYVRTCNHEGSSSSRPAAAAAAAAGRQQQQQQQQQPQRQRQQQQQQQPRRQQQQQQAAAAAAAAGSSSRQQQQQQQQQAAAAAAAGGGTSSHTRSSKHTKTWFSFLGSTIAMTHRNIRCLQRSLFVN